MTCFILFISLCTLVLSFTDCTAHRSGIKICLKKTTVASFGVFECCRRMADIAARVLAAAAAEEKEYAAITVDKPIGRWRWLCFVKIQVKVGRQRCKDRCRSMCRLLELHVSRNRKWFAMSSRLKG